MTLYAGEPVRLTTSATDWDGQALTDLNTEGAWVEVWDANLAVVLPHTALVWDGIRGEWGFTWDTTGLAAGGYRARMVLVGMDGKASWEFLRVRLTRNPVPV